MFSYKISFDGTNWDDLLPMTENKITWEREQGEVFARAKIDEIKIDGRRNISYATLESYFNDKSKFGQPVYYAVYRDGVKKYQFYASINDGKLDSQNKVYYITLRPDDDYRDIMTVYSSKKSIILNDHHFMPTRVPTGILDDMVVFVEATEGVVNYSNYTASPVTGRVILSPDRLTGFRIFVDVKSFSGTPLTVAARFGGTLYSNVVTINAAGLYTLVLTRSGQSRVEFTCPAGGSGSFEYAIYEPIKHNNSVTFQHVLNQLSPVNIRSTILWGDPLPPEAPTGISSYITANPTHDYITKSSRLWDLLILGRISDKDVVSSLKEITDILKFKMRIFWYVDSEGYMRFEHEGYFCSMSPQLDLNGFDKSEIDKKIYRYDKSDIYSHVEYDEPGMVIEDWMVKSMNYDIVKTTINSISITPPLICSDATNAYSDPEAQLILLHCLRQTPERPVAGMGLSSSGWHVTNYYLSWGWLLANYFKYFGEADEAVIGGIVSQIEGVKRFLKQADVKFYYSGDIDFLRPITASGGTAWLDKVELSLDTGFYKINVGFDPYEI